MKPLPWAPLTEEDWNIWWCYRPEPYARWSLWMFLRGQHSDRRDAALMLQCQETWRAGHRRSRPDHPYAGPLEVAWCGYLVDCGGDIMKPLPSAPLTEEDDEIWHELVLTERLDPYFEGMHLWQHSVAADRRDAALMLEAQQVAEWGPAAIELHGIACRGWNDRGYWIEDTDDGEGIWQRD